MPGRFKDDAPQMTMSAKLSWDSADSTEAAAVGCNIPATNMHRHRNNDQEFPSASGGFL